MIAMVVVEEACLWLFVPRFLKSRLPHNQPASTYAYNGGCSSSKHPMALRLQTNAARQHDSPYQYLILNQKRIRQNHHLHHDNAKILQASNVHNSNPSLPLLRPYLVRNPAGLSPTHYTTEQTPNNPTRLELHHPCKPTHNLLTCPDFSAAQPNGPASIPHLHGLPCFTPIWDCPLCGDDEPDLRKKRLCKFRSVGVRIGGRDAGRVQRPRTTGVEFGVGCCGVM